MNVEMETKATTVVAVVVACTIFSKTKEEGKEMESMP